MKKNFVLSAAAVALVAGSAFAAPQELQTFLPAPGADLIANAGQVVTVTFTGAGGYTPAGIRLNYALESRVAGTWANDVVVQINPPNGAAPRFYRSPVQTYTTLPNVGGDFTLANIGITAPDAIGTWTFTFTDDFEDGPVGGVQANLSNVRLALLTLDEPPTVFTTIPAVDTVGTWSTASSTLAANGTTWFQLVVPSAINGTGLGNALDVDMVGTNLAPNNDASMAMYDSVSGQIVAIDNDFGPGALPQISFGRGPRAASGDGQLYAGQDGNALAAATYFIAVRGGDGTFNNLFDVSGGAPNAGPVTMRARYFDAFTNLPPDQVYTDVVNVGNVGTTTAGVENVQTQTFNASGPAIKWFKFATTAGTADNPSYYLDIDTEGSATGVADVAGGLMDTEIGVYDSIGTMLVNDDDDGNGFRSALSFGDTVNIRPAIAPVAPAAAGVARNGRDGALAAGNYWLAVGTYNVTFGGTGWSATSTGAAATAGERIVNFRSNLPVPPSCTCCNASNVAGGNQSTTPDDALTADDIIVFLGWFFANDNRANVAGPNQSTIPDNALTADDIIVFLGRFFSGC